MASERRNSSGPGFLSGFVLGGIIGATIALLYGRRAELASWDQLRDRSLELRRQADDVALRARDAFEEMNQRSRLLVEELQEVLREAMKEGRDSAARTMSDLQNRFQELRSEAVARSGGAAREG